MTEQASVTIKGMPQDSKELSEQIIFLKRLVDYQKEEIETLKHELFKLHGVHAQYTDLLRKAAERLAARPKKEEAGLWPQAAAPAK